MGCHMKKIVILSLALGFLIGGISFGTNSVLNRISDDKILIQSGFPSWVPNPLVGSHKWKQFFSDEKHSSSKKTEFVWYYDSKTAIKATTEKLNLKGQAMGLEGATLVWVKVVELKTNRIMFLFYALWPEKRIALFFGIYEKEDGIKYVEEIGETDDIQKMGPGLPKEVLENLFNAIFKPWWKVW
jgi:hypothetical protein